MRLIDADKLHYIKKYFEDGYKGDVVVFAKEIDKAPTVKAIPWSEICRILYNRPDDHAQIRQMMYEWLWENDSEFRRKENEWWAEHSSRFD